MIPCRTLPLPLRPLALVVVLAGCAPGGVDPIPEGMMMTGDGEVVRRVLEDLSAFAGTPLGGRSRDALGRIGECRAVVGRCPTTADCTLFDRLGCGEGGAAERALRERYPDADWVFSRRAGDGPAVVVRGHGRDRIVAEIRDLDPSGSAGLLVPGDRGPGPGHLAIEDRLLHLRVRPREGLGALVAPESGAWSDRLFKLRADLFLGTALTGVWELVVYLPEKGAELPPIALALDVADLERAETALAAFVRDVRRTWPVRERETDLGGHPGICLSNLKVLPELAPCGVVADEALVLGWNEASVRRALAPGFRDRGEESRGTLSFRRLPEADARLRAASGSAGWSLERYPWDVASWRLGPNGEGIRFEIELERGEGSP